MTTTDTPMLLNPAGVYIICRMDNDRPLARQIVEAWLKSIHAQRVAVSTNIAFLSTEQANTRLVAALYIGKGLRKVISRPLTVSHQVLQQKLPTSQVEYPQPLLTGRQGEIDHRQTVGGCSTTRNSTLHRRNGGKQHLWIKIGRHRRQTAEQIRLWVGIIVSLDSSRFQCGCRAHHQGQTTS